MGLPPTATSAPQAAVVVAGLLAPRLTGRARHEPPVRGLERHERIACAHRAQLGLCRSRLELGTETIRAASCPAPVVQNLVDVAVEFGAPSVLKPTRGIAVRAKCVQPAVDGVQARLLAAEFLLDSSPAAIHLDPAQRQALAPARFEHGGRAPRHIVARRELRRGLVEERWRRADVEARAVAVPR
jgi:hypothetical protein